MSVLNWHASHVSMSLYVLRRNTLLCFGGGNCVGMKSNRLLEDSLLSGFVFFVWSSCQFFYLFVWSSCQFFYLFVWSSCQFFYLFVWSSCQFFYLFVWSSCQFFYLFVWSSCQFFYLFVWSSCQFFYLFVWSSCQFFYFCRRKGKRIWLNRLRLERKCEITISKAFWVWEGRWWQKFFLFLHFFCHKFFSCIDCTVF